MHSIHSNKRVVLGKLKVTDSFCKTTQR